MNPAPDADYHSVGAENFEWIVEHVADLAIKKAHLAQPQSAAFHWSRFLSGGAVDLSAPEDNADSGRKGMAAKATGKREQKAGAKKSVAKKSAP